MAVAEDMAVAARNKPRLGVGLLLRIIGLRLLPAIGWRPVTIARRDHRLGRRRFASTGALRRATGQPVAPGVRPAMLTVVFAMPSALTRSNRVAA